MSAQPETGQPDASRYASRVTVDLDGDKHHDLRLVATRVWYNLRDTADAVDVHVSSSGQGLHFVAYFEESVPFHEQVAIRRSHHDDPRRTDMDVQRRLQGLWTDVLFSQKGDKSKERRFRDVWDALDYIDQQQDDHDRVKALANDGHRGAPDLARRLDE